MPVASRRTDERRTKASLAATMLLMILAVLLGLGLFFAGAAWRARVTSTERGLSIDRGVRLQADPRVRIRRGVRLQADPRVSPSQRRHAA